MKESKWIEADKQLPEIDESTKNDFGYCSTDVIVLNDGCPYITQCHFTPDKKFNRWFQLNAPRQNITHWSYIPEIPKP